MFLFRRTVMGAIHAVALPALAREQRNGRGVKEPYLAGLSHITVVAWPFYAFVGIMAFPVVRVLFGDQWDAAVPLVRLLAAALAIGATWSLSGQILISLGRVREIFWAEIVIQACRLVLIVAAAQHSLEAVAGAQIPVYITGFIEYFVLLAKFIGISFRDVLDATRRSFGVAVCSSLAPAAVALFMEVGAQNISLPLALAVAGGGLGWIAGIILTAHPLKQEIVSSWPNRPRLLSSRQRAGR